MNLRWFAILFIINLMGDPLSVVAQSEPAEKSLLQRLSLAAEDTTKVRLLLELATFYRENPSYIKTKSPFAYASDAETLAQKLKFTKGLGETYRTMSRIKLYHEKDTAAAMGYTKRAIDVFRSINMHTLLGEACYDMNVYYGLTPGDLTERIKWTEIAYTVFQQKNNVRKMADCNRQLGDLLLIAGRSLQGMETLKMALKQYQSIGEKQLHWMYDLIGAAYYALGEYTEAEKYGLMAVKITEELKDFNGQTATVYNRMGVTYHALKAYQKSNDNYDKAMRLATAAHHVDAIYIIAGNTAHLMISMGKQQQALAYLHDIMKRYKFPGEEFEVVISAHLLTIATDLKNTSDANRLVQKLTHAIDHAEKLSWSVQRRAYYSIIHYYHAGRDYTREKHYLAQYIKTSQNVHAFRDLATAHLWASRVDSTQGNFISALSHYRRHKALDDSLFNVIKGNQIKDLEILYEKEKKDNELVSKERDITLLQKKTELRDLEMHRSAVTRNVIIVILVLFVIAIALLLFYSQNKQKSTRSLQHRQDQIEKQNNTLQALLKEKEWLVKEIHHRVKNNFHMVIGLLDSQARFLNHDEFAGIVESQQRIHAISLVHSKLYQSGNLSQINLASYVHDLVQHLKNCYNVPNSVTFETNVQPLDLDISFAQPIGLLLNEAITNGIKHILDGHGGGRIMLTISEYKINTFSLELSASIEGLSNALNIHHVNTTGYELIQQCCAEIGATLDLDNIDSTRIKITAYIKTDNEMIPSDPDHGANKK
jgi:two-component sensor histidine kinase